MPPGSAIVLRVLPGFEHQDESKHFLQCLKPGTGTKDAPRAFSLKLMRTTRGFGLRPTSCDEEFETSSNLLTAKHVDYSIWPFTHAICAVRYTKDEDGSVTLNQDEYFHQLSLIQHLELTGADAGAQSTKIVADMFVSLRGSLAYALLPRCG
eukprot:3024321-Pyramimonas_sp.AAC.1